MSYTKLLIWVSILTLSAVIIAQNGNQPIILRFLIWETGPVEGIVLFLLGILVGVILVLPTLIRNRILIQRKSSTQEALKKNIIEPKQKSQISNSPANAVLSSKHPNSVDPIEPHKSTLSSKPISENDKPNHAKKRLKLDPFDDEDIIKDSSTRTQKKNK